MFSHIFGNNSKITVNLYPIEFKILAAAGFQFRSNPVTLDPRALDQKAVKLMEKINDQCSGSLVDRCLYKVGFGEVSRNWSLAEDLKLVSADLRERFQNPEVQAVRYTMDAVGNALINVFIRVPFSSKNLGYYRGFYS